MLVTSIKTIVTPEHAMLQSVLRLKDVTLHLHETQRHLLSAGVTYGDQRPEDKGHGCLTCACAGCGISMQ